MLDERAPDDLDWNFEILEYDVHVPITNLNNGLLSLSPDYLASDALKKEGLAAVGRHYNNLTQRYGFQIDAPEEVLFNMSFDLKRDKKFQESIKLFQTLLERFPFSVRGTFFLAETYKEMGDIHSATEVYRKTLELDPEFDAAKRRLKEVEKEIK